MIKALTLRLSLAVRVGVLLSFLSPVATSQVPQSGSLTTVAAQDLLERSGLELTDGDLRQVCTATGLTHLRLAGCNRLTDAGVAHVARIVGLQSLDLSQCHRITAAAIESIAGLEHLQRLDISATRMNLPRVYAALQGMSALTRLEVRDVGRFQSRGLERLTGLRYLDISNKSGHLGDAHFAPLSALTSLTYLNANGSRLWKSNKELTDAGLRHLEGLTALRFLGLFGYYRLTHKGYNPLFRKLQKLERLEMGFNWPLKGKAIELPTKLRHLDLMESFHLEDDAVINLKGKPGLRTLNLFYCLELTDKSLAALRGLPDLESLNLGCIRALTDEGLTHLRGNTGLTYLNVGDNDNFSDAGLAHLSGLTAIRELSLWSTPRLTGKGLSVLKNFPRLETLNLADCANLTDVALRHLKGRTGLRELYLDNCTKITDAGIRDLVGLGLRELTLTGCLGLTDGCVETLASLRSLEYLSIDNCPGLSRRRVAALEKGLPDCRVVRD